MFVIKSTIVFYILLKLKDDIESQADEKYVALECVSYISQVVAGTNYFIKVKLSLFCLNK